MNRSRIAFSALLTAFALAACTDETIVYRDRVPFNTPPDTQSGFLGYFTVGTKTTTCGNCHSGHQRDWKTSAHAGAWATLQASGHASATCNGCHTVSGKGNPTTDPAGYTRVADSAYHDVQCESCHGPGFTHVTEPDLTANHPLARVGVADTASSCLDCHSGTHHPFAEEWKLSAHSGVLATPAGRAECASCHEGKATLAAWGANVNYVEKTSTTHLPITCSVCHDPHGSDNPAQLRFPTASPDPQTNLCMRCHARTGEPQVNSSRGPHAPQGHMLLGTAGYWPAGIAYDTALIVTSHGPEGNPGLCATCHVAQFDVNDQVTGQFVFHSTGHLFRAIPCVDAQGVPTGSTTCTYDTAARQFASCAASGCHSTVNTALAAFNTGRNDIRLLARQIWIDVDGDQTLDAFPTDSGYLAKVMANAPAEFTVDATITAAEGALFNMRLVGENYYGNADNSKGVHNPFLARSLLTANINELLSVYPGFLPVTLSPEVAGAMLDIRADRLTPDTKAALLRRVAAR
jgi:predicted CXXCH cytochrome family protein